MNLYLYPPYSSAHPASMIRGLVSGNLQRYFLQNTFEEDFLRITKLFYQRLRNRGYPHKILASAFHDAMALIEKPKLAKEKLSEPKQIFLHAKYHPHDISRSSIQAAFGRTVAYSRPANLRDKLIRAKLPNIPGMEVSSFLQEPSVSLGPSPAT